MKTISGEQYTILFKYGKDKNKKDFIKVSKW